MADVAFTDLKKFGVSSGGCEWLYDINALSTGDKSDEVFTKNIFAFF